MKPEIKYFTIFVIDFRLFIPVVCLTIFLMGGGLNTPLGIAMVIYGLYVYYKEFWEYGWSEILPLFGILHFFLFI